MVFFSQIWDGITLHLLKELSVPPADVEVLRIYLILPIYHEFVNSKNYEKLHSPFSQAVLTMEKVPSSILSEWLAQQPIEYFERLVENFRNVILHIITYKFPRRYNMPSLVKYELNLELALKMIELLYQINNTLRTHRVPYDIFYIPELVEAVDIQQEYVRWMSCRVSVSYVGIDLCSQNSQRTFIFPFYSRIRAISVCAIMHFCSMPRPKLKCCISIKRFKCTLQWNMLRINSFTIFSLVNAPMMQRNLSSST